MPSSQEWMDTIKVVAMGHFCQKLEPLWHLNWEWTNSGPIKQGNTLTTHVVKEFKSMASCQLGSTTTFLPLDKVLPRQLSSHYVNGETSCWQPHSNRSRDREVSDWLQDDDVIPAWKPWLWPHVKEKTKGWATPSPDGRVCSVFVTTLTQQPAGMQLTYTQRPVGLRLNAVSAQQQFKPCFPKSQ